MRRASLSGAWSGAYRYPNDLFPETVFEATFEEVGSAFSGVTFEPNILRPWLSEGVVTASIEGTRRGSDVSFVMDGSGGMDHAMRYFMERADIANEQAIEREAEATQ